MYLCPKNIMRLFYRIASHEKGPECCKKSMNLSQSTFTRPTLLVAPVTAQTFDSFEMRPSKAKLGLPGPAVLPNYDTITVIIFIYFL